MVDMSNAAASHRLLLVGTPRDGADSPAAPAGPVVRRLHLMQLCARQDRDARFAHLRLSHD